MVHHAGDVTPDGKRQALQGMFMQITVVHIKHREDKRRMKWDSGDDQGATEYGEGEKEGEDEEEEEILMGAEYTSQHFQE